jgi:hypothetical protein
MVRSIISYNKDFYDVLAELKRKGEEFTPLTLQELQYDQLILAASGNAGACRCSLSEVINEKRERRALLLALPKEKFETFKLDDVLAGDLQEDRLVIDNKLPSWNDLSPIGKLYFKLACLENHPHDAMSRLTEVVGLLHEVEGSIPQQIAFSLRLEFQSALLSKPSEDWVGDACTKASNMLYGYVTGPEVDIIDRLELLDYVCTAGCFYPLSE